MKERKKEIKKERTDRNRSPSTIARTGPFCYSRAWKPLTPTWVPAVGHPVRVRWVPRSTQKKILSSVQKNVNLAAS